MKKFIKKISSFVAVAVLMTVVSTGAGVVSAAEQSIIDVNEEALLRHLEIIPEGALQYDKGMTRGELAHIAAKTLAATPTSQDGPYFFDVPEEHPYYTDIQALVDHGVVAGDGDGFYRPDDPISQLEICKVFSVVLGYGVVGEFDSYLRVANVSGLTDGVDLSGTITYAHAVQMAYNALNCEMFEKVTYGDESEYKVNAGYLALERYHGLVKQTGVVDGSNGTNLTHPDATIADGQIRIDGTLYDWEDGDSLLGQAVVFYTGRDASSGEANKNIALIYADTTKNTVISMDTGDVHDIKNGKFYYYVKDVEKSVKFSGVADVIINGMAYPEYTVADLKGGAGTGTLKLIDNNDDGVYDVVLVDAYIYMVVKAFDVEKSVLYGRYPAITVGDPNRDDAIVKVRRGDMLALPRSVTEGCVVAIKRSMNLTGTLKIDIQTINSDSYQYVERIDNEVIQVGGIEYQLTSATITDSTVNTKDCVNVYLHNGRVAAILHASAGGYNVGYLVDAAVETEAFSSTLLIKLVDRARDMKEYTGAKNITIDGVVYKNNASGVLSCLGTSATGFYENATTAWPYSQLIRFQLNDDGLLTHIDTVTTDANGNTEGSLSLDAPAQQLMYSPGNRSLLDKTTHELKFSITAPTDVFIVPHLVKDEEKWYVPSLYESDTLTIEGFTIDPENMLAQYAVGYVAKTSSISPSTMPVIVTADNRTLNAEGEIVRQIEVMGSGGTVTKLNLAEGLTNTSLSIGDVIRWRNDRKNIAVEILSVDYPVGSVPDVSSRISAKGNKALGGYAYSSQVYVAYGTPLSIKDDILTHTTSIASDDGNGILNKANLNNYLVSGVPVYIYDRSESATKVQIGNVQDIVTYAMDPVNPDKVYMVCQSGALKYIYIVR